MADYSDADFVELVRALNRYVHEGMDQWDYLRWQTPFGPIFVSIRQGSPEPGVPEAAFRSVDHLLSASG